MKEKDVRGLYFSWLCHQVDAKDYEELLNYLHSREFTYTVPLDGNRAADGVDLRYRFGRQVKADDRIIASCLDICPCSVLEMMVALAIRCEEHIMADPEYGNRTHYWFTEMLRNLGLAKMKDGRFRESSAERIVDRFLNREYEPDGTGGLFYVGDEHGDVRSTEIWYQLCWYLNTVD